MSRLGAVDKIRSRLVMLQAMCSAVLFHLRLIHVPFATVQLISSSLFGILECGVIPVVVFLNNLECPPTADDVTANYLTLNVITQCSVARRSQQLHSLTQRQISLSCKPVKTIKKSSGVLNYFECFREFPECLHRAVGYPRTALMGVVGPISWRCR